MIVFFFSGGGCEVSKSVAVRMTRRRRPWSVVGWLADSIFHTDGRSSFFIILAEEGGEKETVFPQAD